MRELWGPRGELLTHHELGNLQRTESVRGKEPSEGEEGNGDAVKCIERRSEFGEGQEKPVTGQEDRGGLERTS